MKVDVTEYMGAVSREVQSRDHQGRPAQVVIATRTYDTTMDDAWDALTNGERIPRWFLPVSGDLRPGGRYQLEGNAGGQITECDPPRQLAITWEYGGVVSWVKVSLDPVEMANGKWKMVKRQYSAALFHFPSPIFHSGRHSSAAG